MTNKYDAVVIGAGPGGYVCAIRLGQLGLKTAIIEKDAVGGVCLNVGCIPSKALIYAASQFYKAKNEFDHIGIKVSGVECDTEKLFAWKDSVVKKLTQGVGGLLKGAGVDVIKGEARLKDRQTIVVKESGGEREIATSHTVLATGSRNVALPILPINGKNILTSTEALSLKRLPKRLVVIGGGFIGVEIGVAYAKLGVEVHVVEALDQILPNIDRDLVSIAEKKMRKLGMQLHTGARANGLKETDPMKHETLHLEITKGDKQETLAAEAILVAVGRRPNSENLGLESVGVKLDPKGNVITDNRGRTSVPGVYAIGDVNGAPQLAHRASMDGLLVAATIHGETGFRDYKTVPWAVFCDPEIAVCGLSEKEAQEKGIKFRVGKFPFVASGRALSTNETDGFIKVLVAEENESILGVHIVGPEASNLIAEAALAIEMGACAEDVVRTIHTHPTLPEAFPEAIEAAFGHAIHIGNPKRRDPKHA